MTTGLIRIYGLQFRSDLALRLELGVKSVGVCEAVPLQEPEGQRLLGSRLILC